MGIDRELRHGANLALVGAAVGFFLGRFLRAGELEGEQEAPRRPLGLRLDIGDGHGFSYWRRTGTLRDAGPNDHVFELDTASGEIVFGDGAHGARPAAGVDEVRVAYRTGGESAGRDPGGLA